MSIKAITGLPVILDGVTTTPAPADGDLLAPVGLVGVLVGYGRVFTREQDLASQQVALPAVGCAKCFFDKALYKMLPDLVPPAVAQQRLDA